MKKSKLLMVMIGCLVFSFFLAGCSATSSLSSTEDLNLRSDDDVNYTFTYKDEDYYAEYLTDTWTIYDSYKIKSTGDILTICKALCEEHKVPGKDGESYRTPADMAYEWEQHNLAYDYLPEGNYWRECSENVDLDPDDQGKSFKEIYEERTGKELDIDTVLEHKGKIKEKLKEITGSEDLDFDNMDLENIDFEDIDFDKIKQKLKEKIKEKLDEE